MRKHKRLRRIAIVMVVVTIAVVVVVKAVLKHVDRPVQKKERDISKERFAAHNMKRQQKGDRMNNRLKTQP